MDAVNHRHFLAHRAVSSALLGMAIALVSTLTSAQSADQNITFTRDIMPILQENCQTCHRTQGIAPMSLMTYEEVRPWAPLIQYKVVNREMPPWHIDRNIGIQQFKNDRALSDEEVATISAWVNAGAPQGNLADLPERRQFTDATEWTIGTPDLVVAWEYTVPAVGPDLFGELYTRDLFGKMQNNRYIKAIETRTVDDASRRVLHHALSYASSTSDRSTPEEDQFLVEYASGKSAELYPDNSGVLLQPDTEIRLSYHLHPVGVETNAKVELGIVLYPEGVVPEYRRWSKQLAQRQSLIDIPGGEVVRTDGYVYFHTNATITAFQPHMHGLGSYQCLELIYPSGGATAQTEMISCAHWDYNWHTIYNYEDDVAPLVPAGTVAHVISYFDNTETNPGNPDARNWTGDGGRTIDEMSFSWLGWYSMTDEQYVAELNRRKTLHLDGMGEIASAND
ncbi:MAG: cytochrome c [Proteobacteria bacterium]|nr:cytochrome c [Pseudomonadota bacterium]